MFSNFGALGVFAVVLAGSVVDVAVASTAHAGAARRHSQILMRSSNATHDNSTASLERRGPRSRWTWYHTETGNRGSCGDFIKNSDFAVARAAVDMGNNRDCNKVITLEFEGRRAQAVIKDTCPECPPNALDLSQGLFKHIAPNGDGVVYGNWWFGGEDEARKERERKERERKERERKEREERERKEREERERKERERKERERKEREKKEKEEAEERERLRKLKEEEDRANATPTPVIPTDNLDLDGAAPEETGSPTIPGQALPALQQILVQFGSVVAASA